jgi:acetolactate synthase-1/2/3 large subunit
MNGADLFARCLVARGVEWLSTLCGHGLNEVYAACLRQGLRLVDVRNEQTAAYMAECAGRLSGRAGVCAVSSGVAHANALTGVLNAYFDGAPMLLLTGCGPWATAGMGHFQDVDQVALAAPICKYAEAMTVAERIPQYVHEAWEAAHAGRPGPVHLTFPMDVQVDEVDEELGECATVDAIRLSQSPAESAIKRAVELLVAAERPLVVAGSGAFYAGAEEPLAEFAAGFGVPVCVPIWDRGAVPGPMDEYLGVVGAASGGPEFLRDADLLLLLGVAADYRVDYLQGAAKVVRVDVDAGRLVERRRVDLEIAADPGLFMTQLREACIEGQMRGFEAWLDEARRRRDAFCASVRARGRASAEREGGLHALDIIEVLEKVLEPDDVVVVDGGNIGQWFHQTLARRRYPGHWLGCGASGVVGYGIGGALAARLLFPRRRVVLLSGDGAATFNLTDLECAARQDLPFVMIVADDQSWGITVSGHKEHYGQAMSSTLGPVEFAEVARGLGALGARVDRADELEEVLRRGLAERAPTLVHVPIAGGLPGAEG